MITGWKDGVCYLNGKPTPESVAWAALRVEFIKRFSA